MIQRFVDEIVTVTEDDIGRAIVGLVESEHLIAEGAGAVGVAALLAGRAERRSGRIAVVLSGSNIDGVRLAGLLAGRPASD
jgi:threonine dehydratase